MMKTRIFSVAASAAVLLSSAWAMAQTAPIQSETRPVAVDSGLIAAPAGGAGAQVVWSEVVAADGAPWIRLKFDEVTLAQGAEEETAAFLRITSFDDAAIQTMHQWHVEQWRNTSAYFNGDAVLVEVLAFPRTGASRVRMSEVTAGLPPVEPDTICGPTDDRTLSTDPRTARLMPIGCSGWIISDCGHCFLTAGHCTSPMDTVQFNVPLSTSGGALRHPDPEDQYAVDPVSMQSNGGLGIGNDWGYFGVHANSTTGLTPIQAQGQAFNIAATAPSVSGQSIRITGYGTTGAGVPREWNQVQKTHTGPYAEKSGTAVRYRTDTTGGNSGSPVIDETTGLAIGIHSHGGCTSSGGSNAGTAIEHPALQAALAAPRGVCCDGPAPTDAIITNFDAGVGTGTAFGSGSSTGYKAFGFTMTDDYRLEAIALSMNFPDPGPEVEVSIWSGASLPQTQLIMLQNPGTLAGGGEFEFTPAGTFLLQEGETYWVHVAASTPTAGPSFTWDGTNPSTDPAGPGATSVGYIFDGSPSTFRNRLEVRGELGGSGSTLVTGEPNNGSGGVFMDLVNLGAPLRVTSFDLAYTGTAGDPVDVEVWTRPGSYVGFDASSSGWNLTQTVQGVKMGTTTLSPLELTTPILIDGQTAVYLQAVSSPSAGGIRYNGASAAPPQTMWANSDIELFSDVARTGDVPFGGSRFTPRTFAGAVHYELVSGSPLVTAEPNNGRSTGQPGCFFDLTVGGESLVITGWDYYSSAGAGTPTQVSIFYKEGSYVGFDTTPGAWTLHDTVSAVSAGPDAPASLSSPDPLALAAGQTYGVYFRAETGGIRYTGATGVPPTTYATADLTFEGGIVRADPFGGTLFDPRLWSGAIYYEVGESCYADCDGSAGLDFFDFLCFQNAFAAGEPYADCDGSGSLDFFDFLCFQNEFAAGCP